MIHNSTEFPHRWCQKTGARGVLFDLLVIRGTFDLADGAAARPSRSQKPPLATDELLGADGTPLLTAVVRQLAIW